MTPDELSVDLREGESAALARRRGIAGLSFVSMASLGAVALFQLGIVRDLPEPPGRFWDAGKVNGSAEAYSYLGVPDAFLGVASYAVTAALAAAGPADRARSQPWLPIAMAGKTAVDAVQAAKLTVDSWTKYRAFCLFCLVAAGATIATLPLAWKEMRAALETLRSESRA